MGGGMTHPPIMWGVREEKGGGEKLDGNLEKGFGMLRKDNQPQRARSSSLILKRLKEGDKCF